jgi:Zn-dependent protease with chaperone function
MPHVRLFAQLACLLLALVSPTTGLAQNAAPPSPNLTADLQIYVEDNGTATLTLILRAVPSNPQAVEQALGQVFDRPLKRDAAGSGPWGWSLSGRCEQAFAAHGLIRAGEIRVAPLLDALRPLGVVYLGIHLLHPTHTWSHCSLANSEPYFDQSWTEYSFGVDPFPGPTEPIRLEFGYRSEELWRFLPAALGLVLPLGLTLWLRWSAARATAADPLAVWFGCWRRLGLLPLTAWLAWCVAVAAADASRLGAFLLGDVVGNDVLTGVAIFLLPPGLVLLLCRGLAARLLARLPEAAWPLGRAPQTLLTALILSGLFVLVGWIGGTRQLTSRPVLGPGLLFGAFYLGASTAGVVPPRRRTLEPLPPGPLRDRILELADRAEATQPNVYLLPPAHWRLINFFALPGNTIHLAEPLLEHLSQRELDALVNHELAFLWRRRVRRLWAPLAWSFLLLLIGGGFVGLTWLGWIDPLRWWPCVVILAPLLPLFYRVGLLRYGPGQDVAAAGLGGDPQALLTALIKLRRLGLLPLWSYRWEAAPAAEDAPWPRLERLAERVNIPPDRLQELIANPSTGGEHYPVAPAAESPLREERLFTTAFKARLSGRLFLCLYAVLVLAPLLAALAFRAVSGDLALRWLVGLGGLLGAVFLHLLVRNFGAVMGSRSLARQLRDRLEKQGLDVRGGTFVGHAPTAVPRIYEGNFDWDVGFLMLEGDLLRYAGDQTRFCLRRDQITAVRVIACQPGWIRRRRVYVTWRDAVTGSGGTFSLRVADAPSLRAVDWRSRALGKRLLAWWRQPETGAAPANGAAFPLPSTAPTGGVSPGAVLTVSGVISLLWRVLLPLGGLAYLSGLSFDPEGGGEGLYALLVAVVLIAESLLPYWLYRDPRTLDSPPETSPKE